MNKVILLIFVSVLFFATTIEECVNPTEPTGIIYIMVDGGVFPSTAKIVSVDNVTYTFTDNNYESIIVQRDNIVINGAGYTLQGRHMYNSKGIDLTGRRNVTIENLDIKEFFFGIWLKTSSYNNISANKITINKIGIRLSYSSNNSISANNISANMDYNIYLEFSSNNDIFGNNIVANKVWVSNLYYSFYGICLHYSSSNSIYGNSIVNSEYGLQLFSSSNNSISGNSMVNNTYGILLWKSSGNAISENDATGNDYGIALLYSSGNTIYHGNFITNTKHVYNHNSMNVWDDGYPSGGNYWSNYKDRYPSAKEMDGSGIWDTSFVIDENNRDNYPLINPWLPEQEAPPPAEEVPFWMQWRVMEALGILVLAGAVFILKKRVAEKSVLRKL